MSKRTDVVEFLDDFLDINAINDHSMNGLQVQGASDITRVALATDAALVTYRKAIELGCQMLVVHHGFIWGGINYITGRDYEHVATLIKNDLNLYAAHLPLDIHPEVGNNAVLAQIADLKEIEPFGNYHGNLIGLKGEFEHALTVNNLEKLWQKKLGSSTRTLTFGPAEIKTVAIVSGGGSSCLKEAIDAGIDCMVTGEGPHERYHMAKEGRINLMYIGHYKSEITGVMALGKVLEEEFDDIETVFIDEPTGF
jgi:dinuclear metal center YbgI/SA1388 family protein